MIDDESKNRTIKASSSNRATSLYDGDGIMIMLGRAIVSLKIAIFWFAYTIIILTLYNAGLLNFPIGRILSNPAIIAVASVSTLVGTDVLIEYLGKKKRREHAN